MCYVDPLAWRKCYYALCWSLHFLKQTTHCCCCCCCCVVSVVSSSVWPHRRQPTRLPRPLDSPGKNTEMGCHFLLQCMNEKWKWSRSVVSDSQWPQGLQPTRLLHPWDFPGKSTEADCHCLLWNDSLGLHKLPLLLLSIPMTLTQK